MKEQLPLLQVLRAHYLEAQTRNPGYSIRAFARKLGVGASTLSMLLNGQRKASRRLACKISDRLMVSPSVKNSVLAPFDTPRDQKRKTKASPNLLQYLQISADQHEVLSEWYYMAILNLIRLKSFKNDSAWIAARIGITSAQVKDAIERLLRVGILEDRDGRLHRTHAAFTTIDGAANPAVRKSHFQTLELAMRSLECDAVEERDFTWLTMTIRRERLPEMRDFIRRFEDEFALRFGADEGADEVYRMGLQVFPLTKRIQKERKKERT